VKGQKKGKVAPALDHDDEEDEEKVPELDEGEGADAASDGGGDSGRTEDNGAPSNGGFPEAKTQESEEVLKLKAETAQLKSENELLKARLKQGHGAGHGQGANASQVRSHNRPWSYGGRGQAPPRREMGQGKGAVASVVRGGDGMESVHDDRPGKPLSERAKMALSAGLGFFDSSRYRTRPGPSPPMTAGVVGQTSPAVHRYADEEGDIDE